VVVTAVATFAGMVDVSLCTIVVLVTAEHPTDIVDAAERAPDPGGSVSSVDQEAMMRAGRTLRHRRGDD
jgi:hypothetical protein